MYVQQPQQHVHSQHVQQPQYHHVQAPAQSRQVYYQQVQGYAARPQQEYDY
jgi:hypothetical protein